jgi:two-component system phosphate regulon response regulator PhoB
MLKITMATPKVLIIGGDESLGRRLAEQVEGVPCEVVVAADASRGIEQVRIARCDLVLVATSCLHDDPVEVCREIRRAAPDEPPPILLAPSGRTGTVNAEFDGRAPDDEIAADVASLAKGIVTMLSGMRTSRAASRIFRHGIEIDRVRHLVLVDGNETKLTPTEFRILWVLLSEPGRVFSRNRLTELCIGENAPVTERTIDVHIKAIRQKLRGRADAVETVRGVGYRSATAIMGANDEAGPEENSAEGKSDTPSF